MPLRPPKPGSLLAVTGLLRRQAHALLLFFSHLILSEAVIIITGCRPRVGTLSDFQSPASVIESGLNHGMEPVITRPSVALDLYHSHRFMLERWRRPVFRDCVLIIPNHRRALEL
jgi:hypothetical protein